MYYVLCVTLHKIKKKRFSIFIWFDRIFGDTGEWEQSRDTKKATCLTSCIVPHWYTNFTLPHCLPLTCSHTPSATQTLSCKQKLEIVCLKHSLWHNSSTKLIVFQKLCQAWGAKIFICSVTPGCPRLQHTDKHSLHYPGYSTMTGHLRLDSVIAES